MNAPPRGFQHQSGAALIVGLIMLILMMMLAISTIELGRSSLMIVGNMQLHNQVVDAANGAIEDAISTTRMFKAPTAIYLVPCTTLNTKCVDINGDGVNDIQVALVPAPRCVQAHVIPLSQLDLGVAANRGCTVSRGSDSAGIENGPGTASLCSNTMFDVTSTATDLSSNAGVTINEGINVQVNTNDIATNCP